MSAPFAFLTGQGNGRPDAALDECLEPVDDALVRVDSGTGENLPPVPGARPTLDDVRTVTVFPVIHDCIVKGRQDDCGKQLSRPGALLVIESRIVIVGHELILLAVERLHRNRPIPQDHLKNDRTTTCSFGSDTQPIVDIRNSEPYTHRRRNFNFFLHLMPKINGNEIRPGNVLEHNGGLWNVVKVDHVKPGKGGAFAQVELRNLRSNSKLNERFRSADRVERIRLEQRDHQFLYRDGEHLVFMDTEMFDQVHLSADLLGNGLPFLQEGLVVLVEFHGDEALNVTLPQKVSCTVEETEPVITGQTAANSFKPAVLSNGLKISVPPFIGQGDEVMVNTETLAYSERA